MKKVCYLLLCCAAFGCGTVQSIVKSTFPYTTTLVVPASAPVGQEISAISTATSFDQNLGNNASRISDVHIVSAKMNATNPKDYNISDLQSVKIYMATEKGSDELLVASRTDIGPYVGNSIVLDINDAHTLDMLVRQPKVRVRMEYKVRNKNTTDVSFHIVLSVKGKANN